MGADPVSLTAIASIIGAGVSAGSALGMFGGGDKPQAAAPTVKAPTVMPEPDDDAAKKAKTRQAAAMTQRRGRQSTILSEDTGGGDLLGG